MSFSHRGANRSQEYKEIFMAFHLFNRHRNCVGVHFGEDWLTGVVLVQGGELIKRCDGVELVEYESHAKALKALVAELDARGGLVTANIDPDQVFSRVMQINADLEDTEIHEQAQIAATEALGLDIAEIALDYSVQGVSYASEAKADVLLFACPMALIDEREKLLADAGLKVRAIEPQEHSLQRAYGNMVRDLPDTHHRYVTAMLSASREGFCIWLFRGRAFEHLVRLPMTSGWERVWDADKPTKAIESLSVSETRALCEQLHEQSKAQLGERIARWLLLPSNLSKHLADALQEVDAPMAIIEMRPNPDSEKAGRVPSDGVIMAFGLALAGVGA